MYVNGQVARDTTIAANTIVYWSGNDSFRIGCWGNTSYKFTGYIDEFIVTNGIALWNDTFTPPTELFTNIAGDIIKSAYAKVSGVWQNLIGTNIDDINLGYYSTFSQEV